MMDVIAVIGNNKGEEVKHDGGGGVNGFYQRLKSPTASGSSMEDDYPSQKKDHEEQQQQVVVEEILVTPKSPDLLITINPQSSKAKSRNNSLLGKMMPFKSKFRGSFVAFARDEGAVSGTVGGIAIRDTLALSKTVDLTDHVSALNYKNAIANPSRYDVGSSSPEGVEAAADRIVSLRSKGVLPLEEQDIITLSGVLASPNPAALALQKGESVEMVVDPSPDSTNRYKTRMFLTKDGARQPQVMYSTPSSLLDYLLSPRVTNSKFREIMQTLKNEQNKLSPWLIAQWDAFFLNYESLMRTETLVTLLISKYHEIDVDPNTVPKAANSASPSLTTTTTTTTTPLSSSPTTKEFGILPVETREGFIIALKSRFATPNANIHTGPSENARKSILSATFLQKTSSQIPNPLISRSLDPTSLKRNYGVLNNIGLPYQKYILAVRQQILSFIEYWLAERIGLVKLCADPSSYMMFRSFLSDISQGNIESDVGLIKLATYLLDEIKKSEQSCGSIANNSLYDGSSLEKVPHPLVMEEAIKFDPTGQLMRQHMTNDDLNIHFLSLCYSRRGLPKWFTKSISLRDFSPKLVAHEITIIMYNNAYRHIRPEMLYSRQERMSCNHVLNMVRYFKIASWWPLTMILDPKITQGQRSELLTYFIEVAQECRTVNNFHALFAIVSALCQPFMTWVLESIRPKDLKILEELKRAVSPAHDYRVHRADLSKCEGASQIPFLGLTNRSLLSLEDEMKLKERGKNQSNLVNFNLSISRSAAILEFLEGLKNPYYTRSGEAFRLFTGSPGLSPFPRSQIIESGSNQIVLNPSVAVTLKDPTSTRNLFNVTSPWESATTAWDIDRSTNVADQMMQLKSLAHSSSSSSVKKESKFCSHSIVDSPTSGSINLQHDSDLALLLAYLFSQTETEEVLRDLALQCQASTHVVVVDTLEAAGFI